MTPTLFDTAAPFVLWHRAPGPGQRWRIVGGADTHLGAVALMSGSGEYMVKPPGAHPNTKSPVNAQPGAKDGTRGTG